MARMSPVEMQSLRHSMIRKGETQQDSRRMIDAAAGNAADGGVGVRMRVGIWRW